MKLNKCLCGGTPKIVESRRKYDLYGNYDFDCIGDVMFAVQCQDCEATTYNHLIKEDAIKEWNKEN